ncbi:DUF4115 domain-containing protein [Thalassotalea psychrophila]|uniref:DUF4115 domain-containing protein n=1 Tax=Thalassotalea psychrophila TaxID=3065647 RepID=A0ABY9TS08_9GAMM|nr:DUF4115 domain-containing protein [Colwelliaceae bacterium SQ149]
MSDNQEPIDISDDIVVIGPGQMLKDARIALGLSEAEVAEHLNLRLALITDFENEQFDTNMPATFLRGYLKNYAKFVGVSQTDIIASYEMLAVAEKQGDEMKSFSQSTRKKAENNRLMMIIYAIGFSLVALFIVWWWQESKLKEATPALSNTEQSQPASILEPISTADMTTEESSSAIEPVVEELAENIEEEPADKAFEQHIANNPDTAAVEANKINTVVEPEPLVEEMVQLERLVFQFSGDCWVNIFDANGERLAWGIKKADYIMTLNGKAPFSITLGKPELVSIDYNEVAIDMSQFQQGQIAKFTWPKS